MFYSKKHLLVLLMVLAVILVMAGCNAKPSEEVGNKVIKVGTSGRYHPFTFMNKEGKLDGFEIDVWNEIGRRIGYDVEYNTAEFSGLFGMLDAGKIDTIANQITITEQRKEKYLFPVPYVYSGAQLIVKKGNDDIKSLEDLKGKKVGVSLGSNYEQLIREYDINNEIEVITYEDFVGSLQDVSIGRIDAVVNDKLAGVINIKESGLDLQLGGNTVHPLENSFPFVNSEENKELVENINKAIEEMREDGTLAEISNKWFDLDVTSK
ncbi:amino acid ABC transporter substrate-binding protein [Paramaledivibacter caminithermalis]|jgi:ABC-type amino acid transport substrate-binding protein|uniref:Amino acid ABC transporter substrate-binding protein, PAAT family (TC 3.A.1.3.-) n=1 Tax=Paramaledivibacter caminithermalis (strain DSM 15212 / CIP 107654 / DViRD3) TaxID=1121301 RepID=A0A1M6M5A9_PARC5|nr:amino acid ABC transporter substrate-binding protein [Paramaledivibacter caminithermalis]SHJ78628.1 amino acid ABC transporter substrate-binding protein, PAAT family (TC 3.A.1.3.-) [Paramaledivibacter caminithermalis DSM 15212]